MSDHAAPPKEVDAPALDEETGRRLRSHVESDAAFTAAVEAGRTAYTRGEHRPLTTVVADLRRKLATFT